MPTTHPACRRRSRLMPTGSRVSARSRSPAALNHPNIILGVEKSGGTFALARRSSWNIRAAHVIRPSVERSREQRTPRRQSREAAGNGPPGGLDCYLDSEGEVMRYVGVVAGLLCLTSGGAAWAGPVVREATGPTAASIQAAVDQFRSDLGPNNGVVAGSQGAGAGKSTGTAAALPLHRPSIRVR